MLLALISSQRYDNACDRALDAGFWTHRAISQREEVFHTAGDLGSIAVADDGQRETVPRAVSLQQGEMGHKCDEDNNTTHT